MSDFRRRFVRFSVFLLPAFLLLAGLHFFRSDLREVVSKFLSPGQRRGLHVYHDRRKDRVDKISKWTETVIAQLQDRKYRAFGFKLPEQGFRIEIRREPRAPEYDPVLNRIIIRGIQDEVPAEMLRTDLSRLIARAMLKAGAPSDAEFSPWFEDGVATFFEGTAEPLGSRKQGLLDVARLNAPDSLAAALALKGGEPYFTEISHSVVAFMKAFSESQIAAYTAIEREPGPVPPGTFERIFGHDAGMGWRNYLENR